MSRSEYVDKSLDILYMTYRLNDKYTSLKLLTLDQSKQLQDTSFIIKSNENNNNNDQYILLNTKIESKILSLQLTIYFGVKIQSVSIAYKKSRTLYDRNKILKNSNQKITKKIRNFYTTRRERKRRRRRKF